jgi:hypothetical protein
VFLDRGLELSSLLKLFCMMSELCGMTSFGYGRVMRQIQRALACLVTSTTHCRNIHSHDKSAHRKHFGKSWRVADVLMWF